MSDHLGRAWSFHVDDRIGFAEKVAAYDDILWSIIQDDMPALLTELRVLRAKL